MQEVYPGLGIELAGFIDAFGIYRGACWITDGQTLWTHALNEFVSYDLHEKIISKHGSIPGIKLHDLKGMYFYQNKLYFLVPGDKRDDSSKNHLLYSIDYLSMDSSTLTRHFSLQSSAMSFSRITKIQGNKLYICFSESIPSGEEQEYAGKYDSKDGILEYDLYTNEKRIVMKYNKYDLRSNEIYLWRDLFHNNLVGPCFGHYWMMHEIIGKNGKIIGQRYYIYDSSVSLNCIIVTNPSHSFRREFLKTHNDGTYLYFFKDQHTLYRWKTPLK